MALIRVPAAVLVVICLFGCVSRPLIVVSSEAEAWQELFGGMAPGMAQLSYYLGSDGDGHFIEVQRGKGSQPTIKIPRDVLTIHGVEERPYVKDHPVLWGVAANPEEHDLAVLSFRLPPDHPEGSAWYHRLQSPYLYQSQSAEKE